MAVNYYSIKINLNIMNIVVINASPRKRGNTAELCKHVVEGAMDIGADVEYVNLYSYDFKGCMSCFACHLKKNMDNPLCFWRDDLKDILRTCLKLMQLSLGLQYITVLSLPTHKHFWKDCFLQQTLIF